MIQIILYHIIQRNLFIFINRNIVREIVKYVYIVFEFFFSFLFLLALKLQLNIIKESQMKRRKVIHLLESYTNKKKIYVSQKTK